MFRNYNKCIHLLQIILSVEFLIPNNPVERILKQSMVNMMCCIYVPSLYGKAIWYSNNGVYWKQLLKDLRNALWTRSTHKMENLLHVYIIQIKKELAKQFPCPQSRTSTWSCLGLSSRNSKITGDINDCCIWTRSAFYAMSNIYLNRLHGFLYGWKESIFSAILFASSALG